MILIPCFFFFFFLLSTTYNLLIFNLLKVFAIIIEDEESRAAVGLVVLASGVFGPPVEVEPAILVFVDFIMDFAAPTC